MSSYPSKQLTLAFESLKNKPTGEVVFGKNKEHKLIKSKIYDSSIVDKGVTYTYEHYGTTVVLIDVYMSGDKLPFIIRGWSNTDRDNVNGLLKLTGTTNYKAYIKDKCLHVKRVE